MAKTSPLVVALREKLSRSFSSHDFKVRLRPDYMVPGSHGSVFWTDEFGITFGENAAEQKIINEWITEFIGKKIGFSIRVIKMIECGGSCALWFKKNRVKK